MKTKRLLAACACFLQTLLVTAQPNYNMQQIQREQLDRGVVALRNADGQVYVTWRLLEGESTETPFNVYRNGQLLTRQPLTQGGTFYIDESPITGDAVYEVRGGQTDGQWNLASQSPTGYIAIPLDKPEGGETPDGRHFEYTANDASIGDVDGDGAYELILKWEPTNAHDNSHAGYTGNVLIDCYKILPTSSIPAGEGSSHRLWRIDLGRNIRAGAHYTQFLVYDFDGDGRSELMVKTADGTIDGQGNAIGDPTQDWRSHERNNRLGHILDGPEFLSVFDGQTGCVLKTTDYLPARGNITTWGDNYGNRVDRFLAGVGYLDGIHPSALFCRGYYTRTAIVAWNWDGKDLTPHWVFDTAKKQRAPGEDWRSYAGQGNHNLRIADVDGDGCDEITYGSMCVDHDGRGLYNTGFGHGDAIHLVPSPTDGQLYIWDCHENKRDGVDFRHAATGRVIFQNKSPMDVGRCMAADIDPTHPGYELWSVADPHIYNMKGEVVRESVNGRSTCNFGIWWDGDLLRELLDHETVLKYNWQENRFDPLFRFEGCRFNNGTKSNPCLSADILGDWREEVVVRTTDSRELRLYVSPHPTAHRLTCLEEDIPYRLSVAAENTAYNQPPEPARYIGAR